MKKHRSNSTAVYHFVSFILFSALTQYATLAQPSEQTLCHRVFSFAFERKLIEKPIADIIVEVGKQFLNTPYEANTLDRSDSNEQLIVNLHSFDCVTFIENVIALSRSIKQNRLTYENYAHELQRIRYRNGKVDGYASRLHYFTDWIHDNEKKGLMKDVTNELGGILLHERINFMTTHRNLYPQLADDSTFNAMHVAEDSLATQQVYYIPLVSFRNHYPTIRNGDIIAVTTDKAGLDISHTGTATVARDGTVHFLHASETDNVVMITQPSLWKYLERNRHNTGILVVRAVEP